MKTIGIHAPALSSGLAATFDALGEALGVSFEKRALGDDRNISGWVVLEADRTLLPEIGRTTRPCYVILEAAASDLHGTTPRLSFADRPELDVLLRGRNITADDAPGVRPLPRWLENVLPLAFSDGSPLWAVQERAGCRHHYVTLPLPELNDGEPLFAHFSGRRLARLLPLVLFVRSLVEDGWEPPPLQAAFMFDDPNLHWTLYGFIDYGEMVSRAMAGDYHVALATIPLDAWFVHGPASALFKKNAGRISLLYHGNDHLFRELGGSLSPEAMRSLLSQATGRIAAMQARTGLEVARVMAPPHGACGETAMSEMAGLGFEAVCVSRGSLRHYNPRAAWTRTLGMQPCDIVGGLPVIPRFGLSNSCRNDILIAALLRQPIVPMTHHQAVADGYDLLDEAASVVNGLGDVSWRDMTTISRALYSRRQDGSTLRVKMWSRRVSVQVPEGTGQIQVERSRDDSAEAELFWRIEKGDGQWNVASPAGIALIEAGGTIEIARGRAGLGRVSARDVGRPRLTPIARRLLTEGRDRVLPSVHRISRRGRSSRPA